MKQSTPIKWIEMAEARAVCQLAAADPGALSVQPQDPPPRTRRARLLGALRRTAAAGGVTLRVARRTLLPRRSRR